MRSKCWSNKKPKVQEKMRETSFRHILQWKEREHRFKRVEQGWQIFSAKDQMVNIFGFAGHIVSITTLQLC